ncbi:hypothetical protein ACQKLP_10650 [Chitinophaga sp. NPDC101104]|uniref:hypothetical protein n=1 Tax=Chitinophaga sp. NPDC101104 TaxID=3390561 RepID=UPI003D07D1E0
MIVILIDPNFQTVFRFELDGFDDFHDSISYVLETENWYCLKDVDDTHVMYVIKDGANDPGNQAFVICETGENIFGKALICKLSKRDYLSPINCTLSVKKAKDLIVFCNREESQIYREFERNETDSLL